MKYFLIIATLIFVSYHPAYANNCDKKNLQIASAEIKRLDATLYSIKPIDSYENSDADLPMALMDVAVDHWIMAELQCQPENFDSEKFASLINSNVSQMTSSHSLLKYIYDIASVIKNITSFNKNISSENGPEYGQINIVPKFYPDQNLLLVSVSQDSVCTVEDALFGYRHDSDGLGWRKIISLSKDVASRPPSYKFKSPIFITDPATGHSDMLLESIPGQCNSSWYHFNILVFDLTNHEGPEKIIFSRDGEYFNGELIDDGGPDIKVIKNRFQLKYDNPDFRDGGDGSWSTTETYELNNGVVRAIKSLN